VHLEVPLQKVTKAIRVPLVTRAQKETKELRVLPEERVPKEKDKKARREHRAQKGLLGRKVPLETREKKVLATKEKRAAMGLQDPKVTRAQRARLALMAIKEIRAN
jgi:hypothetical protein